MRGLLQRIERIARRPAAPPAAQGPGTGHDGAPATAGAPTGSDPRPADSAAEQPTAVEEAVPAAPAGGDEATPAAAVLGGDEPTPPVTTPDGQETTVAAAGRDGQETAPAATTSDGQETAVAATAPAGQEASATPATPDGAAATELPAGVDPAATRGAPGIRERSRLRRRVRYLRRAREVLLRDVGGLAFDLHRFGGGVAPRGEAVPDPLAAKLADLEASERERRALEEVLGSGGGIREVREAGIGGECGRCGALHGSDARFCSTCGAPVPTDSDSAGQTASPDGNASEAPNGAGPGGTAEATVRPSEASRSTDASGSPASTPTDATADAGR